MTETPEPIPGQLALVPDPGTTSVLDTVDTDWRREWDRERIDDAVRRVAAKHGGQVDTNHVRRELTNDHGLVVNPRTIGPRLATLTRQGVLRWDGEWNVNDDAAGRNAGKPQRLRRWVGGPL